MESSETKSSVVDAGCKVLECVIPHCCVVTRIASLRRWSHCLRSWQVHAAGQCNQTRSAGQISAADRIFYTLHNHNSSFVLPRFSLCLPTRAEKSPGEERLIDPGQLNCAQSRQNAAVLSRQFGNSRLQSCVPAQNPASTSSIRQTAVNCRCL